MVEAQECAELQDALKHRINTILPRTKQVQRKRAKPCWREQADTEAWAVFGVSFFKAHFCMGCNVEQSVESTCDFSESTLGSSAVVESQNAPWFKS